MWSRRLAGAVGLAFVLAARTATAETIQLVNGAECLTAKGAELHLDPGFYLPEPDWSKMDSEIKRLQEIETRLTAENKVLKQPDDPLSAGMITIIGAAVAAGFAAGLLIRR